MENVIHKNPEELAVMHHGKCLERYIKEHRFGVTTASELLLMSRQSLYNLFKREKFESYHVEILSQKLGIPSETFFSEGIKKTTRHVCDIVHYSSFKKEETGVSLIQESDRIKRFISDYFHQLTKYVRSAKKNIIFSIPHFYQNDLESDFYEMKDFFVAERKKFFTKLEGFLIKKQHIEMNILLGVSPHSSGSSIHGFLAADRVLLRHFLELYKKRRNIKIVTTSEDFNKQVSFIIDDRYIIKQNRYFFDNIFRPSFSFYIEKFSPCEDPKNSSELNYFNIKDLLKNAHLSYTIENLFLQAEKLPEIDSFLNTLTDSVSKQLIQSYKSLPSSYNLMIFEYFSSNQRYEQEMRKQRLPFLKEFFNLWVHLKML